MESFLPSLCGGFFSVTIRRPVKKVTVPDIMGFKAQQRRLPVLTAYSFPVARILDGVGVPLLLVGDSVGMVEAGYDTTLPVTLDEMVYHTRAVRRGAKSALVVSDMPFMSYQAGVDDAVRNAGRLVKEAGAEAVKLEGGVIVAETIRAIVAAGIPVMAHVGLTPQSVLRMGGYKVQGRPEAEAERILEDALAVEDAGAFSVVLEGIPAALGTRITTELKIPTIGIGAGPECDGQVLVVNDMLGLTPGQRPPKFVKKYADLEKTIGEAASRYIKDVEKGAFPAKKHSY